MPRWPAVPAEMFFNLAVLAVLFALRKAPPLRGQLFHLYLIAYGLFRFGHEFLRETPRILGFLSGYQIASLAVLALGIWRFRERARARPRIQPFSSGS